MTNSVKRWSLVATTAFLLGALVWLFTPEAQAQSRVKLILPGPPTTYQLPYLIPQDTGWYKQHGLEVEEVHVGGDATTLRTVLAGSGDLAMVGPQTLFQAYNQGAKVKYIAAPQLLVDYYIISTKDITQLSQLADKVFASSGPVDMTTELPRLLLHNLGIDTAQMKFIQVGGHADRLQAVIAGKAQGAMVNSLTAQIGERNGTINTLAELSSKFPKLGYTLLAAKQSDLDAPEKRKAYEIFVEGLIYGARLIDSNPDRAADVLLKRVPDLPPDLIKAVIAKLNAAKVWGINGGLDPEMVTYTSDVSVKWKMIDKGVTPQEIIDDRVVKAALAKLGTK